MKTNTFLITSYGLTSNQLLKTYNWSDTTDGLGYKAEDFAYIMLCVMRNVVFLSVAGLLFSFGCASFGHASESSYSFVETDKEGQPVRTLDLALTDQKGRACIGGKWKLARIVSDPQSYARNPVYTLENGILNVLLINGICNVYDSYIGDITNGVFEGNHVRYGWGSKTLGKVRGSLNNE
jgi:hypothetical protein